MTRFQLACRHRGDTRCDLLREMLLCAGSRDPHSRPESNCQGYMNELVSALCLRYRPATVHGIPPDVLWYRCSTMLCPPATCHSPSEREIHHVTTVAPGTNAENYDYVMSVQRLTSDVDARAYQLQERHEVLVIPGSTTSRRSTTLERGLDTKGDGYATKEREKLVNRTLVLFAVMWRLRPCLGQHVSDTFTGGLTYGLPLTADVDGNLNC
ncbi:hypothetical protein Bbelb_443410 [Branchiostoma belcheri]|nr:hypothetical protein Bbelb_443410 [Branchiostoma belcheri]